MIRRKEKYMLMSTLIMLLLSIRADACEVTFRPEKVTGRPGDIVEITTVVWWEHRRCLLGKDEVDIDIDGGKLLSQSGWNKVGRGVYENKLKIKLLKKGETTIDVHRRCRKKGVSRGVMKITVK